MNLSLKAANNAFHRRRWFALPQRVYRPYPCARATESDLARWLVGGRSLFCRHAEIHPFLILRGHRVVGRFALIRDQRLADYVQVSFFEALPGLQGVEALVLRKARAMYPDCSRVVVGLDGHLNYACGFLASTFDEPPVFGLPYTPPYYLDYFCGLQRRDLVSYRFGNQGFYDLRRRVEPLLDLGDIRIRLMSKRHFERDIDYYTELNNLCFVDHPYWSHRQSSEDLELFAGFKWFLDDGNLIFAEVDGRPVAFLLWYPDFNELVGPGHELGPRALARYRLGQRLGRGAIKTVRLTEIAVHPEFRSRKVLAGLTMKMIEQVERGGYLFTEGGFIFEDNQGSIGYTLAYISRATGREPQPHRRYCVFEATLR